MEKLSNDDLISRNDVLRVFYNKEPIVQGEHDGMGMLAYGLWRHIREAVESIPPVEAEPVVHAHWINMQEDELTDGMWRCSVCSSDRYFDIMTPLEAGCYRCPNCGAHMDEKVAE